MMFDPIAFNNKMFKIIAPIILIFLLVGMIRSCGEPKERAIGEAEYNLGLNAARATFSSVQSIKGIKILKDDSIKKGAYWNMSIEFNLDIYDEYFFPSYLNEQGWTLVNDKYYTHPSSGEFRHRRLYCKNGVALYMDDLYVIGQSNKPDGISMNFQPHFCEHYIPVPNT